MGIWRAANKVAVALWSYSGTGGKYEVPFEAGEEIQVVEQTDEWFKGYPLKNKSSKGIFPINFFRVEDSPGLIVVSGLKQADIEPLLKEICESLKEWTVMWKEIYSKCDFVEYEKLYKRMTDMRDLRNQLTRPFLEDKVLDSIREKIFRQIEEGREYLKLDKVVRKEDGSLVDVNKVPLSEVYRIHRHLIHDKPYRIGQAIPVKPVKAKTVQTGETNAQILMDLKSVICAVDGDMELFFRLYSKKDKKFLTEEFTAHYSATGLPHDLDSLNEMKTIFRDVTQREIMEGQLYLICRLIRKGKLMTKGKNMISYRRPFGCACVELTPEMLRPEKEVPSNFSSLKEHRMIIYTSSNENLFASLHEQIIARSPNIEQVPRSIGIDVTLMTMHMEFQQFEEIFKGIAVTQKLSFGEVILPGENRNDLYLVIQGGEFLQGRKTSAMNCEAILNVKLDDGSLVQDCITLGVGNTKPASEYRTYVYYHTNSPRWEELVCLRVPEELYEKAHCYFQFRHCSTSENKAKEEKPFSFGFLPLVEPDETVRKDGNHSLQTYKFPPKPPDDPAWYLRPQEKQLIARGKETLAVQSSFVSTKLTQNISLLALLRWKTYPTNLADILNKFTYIEQIEIMKFLREIFDALFQILAEKTEEMAMLVYNAIVFIIGILVDDKTTKFTNFKPILDVYISDHFSSEAAHKMLLMCLKQCLENQENVKFAAQIRSSMKALEFLFKFMIASRVLFKARHPQTQDTLFKRDMRELLQLINDLMSRTSPEWVIGAQAIALRSVSLFDELAKIFDRKELAAITCRFIDSVQQSAKRHINIEKLSLIQALVNGQLFIHEDFRRILMPTVKMHVEQHLQSHQMNEVKACTLILSDLCNILEQKMPNPQIVSVELSSMLPMIQGHILHCMETHRKEQEVVAKIQQVEQKSANAAAAQTKAKGKKGEQVQGEKQEVKGASTATEPEEALGSDVLGYMEQRAILNKENPDVDTILESERELFSVFFTVYHFMPTKLFNLLLSKKADTVAFAVEFCDILGFVLHNHTVYFPDNWRVITAFDLSVIMKLLDNLAHQFESPLFGGPAIDVGLLEKFFLLCRKFICHQQLKLEKFTEQKASYVKHRYGDMRVQLVRSLAHLWDFLPNEVTDGFHPKFVPLFLDLVKVDCDECAQVGLNLYFSMVQREFDLSNSFASMERQTIDTLDVISEARGDLQRLDDLREHYGDARTFTQFKDFFVKSISERFVAASAENQEIGRLGEKFLEDIDKVVSLMLALSDFPDTQEYEDERTAAILELLEYLKETKRMATYIKFVHQLCDGHLRSRNYTEAAIALKLHHELLSWTEDPVPEDLQYWKYPAKSQRALKTQLYNQAIDLYDQGKSWEFALLLSAELRNLYQNRWYDFKRLSELLEKEVKFYAAIVETERFYAEYFRVSFYGSKFDENHRNRHFIVRGYELERIIEFIGRIKNRWPVAEILQSNAPPSDEIVNGEKQYIQIVNVRPCSREQMSGIEPPVNKQIPPRIQKFYENNSVECFTFSRPIKKSKKKSDNEFKDLWLAKTYFTTKDMFPTTHRRSEITDTVVVEVNPLENALAGMRTKNADLEEFVAQFKNPETRPANISPFTMALNGVIDAAVNGGVFKYKDAFFTEEYIEENPDHGPQVEEVKQLLNNQLVIVQDGLIVHKKIVPAEMMALHEKMEAFFKKMKFELTGEGEDPDLGTGSSQAAEAASAEPEAATESKPAAETPHPEVETPTGSAAANNGAFAEHERPPTPGSPKPGMVGAVATPFAAAGGGAQPVVHRLSDSGKPSIPDSPRPASPLTVSSASTMKPAGAAPTPSGAGVGKPSGPAPSAPSEVAKPIGIAPAPSGPPAKPPGGPPTPSGPPAKPPGGPPTPSGPPARPSGPAPTTPTATKPTGMAPTPGGPPQRPTVPRPRGGMTRTFSNVGPAMSPPTSAPARPPPGPK